MAPERPDTRRPMVAPAGKPKPTAEAEKSAPAESEDTAGASKEREGETADTDLGSKSVKRRNQRKLQ